MLDPSATGQAYGVQAQARRYIQNRNVAHASQSARCPYPDMRMCLIAQKLQLLDCCIAQRLRPSMDDSTHTGQRHTSDESANLRHEAEHRNAHSDIASEAGSDEFFDSNDAAHDPESSPALRRRSSLQRLHREARHFEAASADNGSGSQQFVTPALADLCPLTSDMLTEQSDPDRAKRLVEGVVTADVQVSHALCLCLFQ